MSSTTLANLYDPEVLLEAIAERFTAVSKLVQSGMVASIPSIRTAVLNGEGTVISIPSLLLNDDDSEIPSSSDLTYSNVTSAMQLALLHHRAKGWSNNDLAVAISGTKDAMNALANLEADFWARQSQKIAIASLTGVIADNIANDSSDLVNDISAESGDAGKISIGALIDTFTKFGDSAEDVVGIAMHPVTFANYQKQQVSLTANDAMIIKGLYIDKALGKYILVDDTCPVDSGEYTTYVFKKGALALNIMVNDVLTTNAEANGGQGSSGLISRFRGVVHPNGFTYKGAVAGESATFTELETATNWDRVLELKKTGIAALITAG